MSGMSKSYLVTGANRGLGLEFCRQLAARGDRVFAGCRHPDKATDLNALKGDITVIPLDVISRESRAAAVAAVSARTSRLDVVINNAGIGIMDALDTTDEEAILRSCHVNAVAPLMVIRAFLPLLGAAVPGSLAVVVTSLIGSIAHKEILHKGGYAYSASKAAANMIVRYLSLDLADRGIWSLAISPGWVATDMGGPEAPLRPPESITGMLHEIDTMTAPRSGTFVHYDGTPLPW